MAVMQGMNDEPTRGGDSKWEDEAATEVEYNKGGGKGGNESKTMEDMESAGGGGRGPVGAGSYVNADRGEVSGWQNYH